MVKTCPCVPDRIGIWMCWFLRGAETGVHGEKPLGAKERINSKRDRRRDSNPGHISGRRLLSPLQYPCSPNGIENAVAWRRAHSIPLDPTDAFSLTPHVLFRVSAHSSCQLLVNKIKEN